MKKRLFLSGLIIAACLQLVALPPKREFRGVWIATINQLDWPSLPGGSANNQKQELIRMLNLLEKMNFNAVFFQVRPAADAFYQSETEPWSFWLSGEQGKAPDAGWDPLAFIISECHKRGMELHAWFNPFRVSQNHSITLSPRNIALREPSWVVDYDNKRFLDPGLPEVRRYLNGVVAEVVTKYDVDAIHMDDYFYPYPSISLPFPDTSSFRQYNRGYDPSRIDDWRRENVDSIIFTLNQTIKKIKPQVKFGISPFGIWRNQDKDPLGSATKAALTNYDHLYADVMKWQKNGWVDYLVPQLYWEFNHPAADFNILAQWWDKQAYGRHIYLGHAAFKTVEAAGTAWNNPNEVPDQVKLARHLKNVSGSAFFRMQHLEMNAGGYADSLLSNYFTTRALLPVMPWLDRKVPNPPSRFKLSKGILKWEFSEKLPASDDTLGYLIYYSNNKKGFNRNNPEYLVAYTTDLSYELTDYPGQEDAPVYLWLTTLDKQHNESRPIGPVKYKTKQ